MASFSNWSDTPNPAEEGFGWVGGMDKTRFAAVDEGLRGGRPVPNLRHEAAPTAGRPDQSLQCFPLWDLLAD